MCGIAGALGAGNEGLARAMVEAVRHRGPDGRAEWMSGPVQLAVARLAIVDLDAPAAPIANESGTIRLAFNGEIYNHRELRVRLEARGHRFRTKTDGEVVLHLYEEHGAACVSALRGMFAFAVADGNRVLLARDRLGIKPLYYSHLDAQELFLFASEIKALLRCTELDPRLDLQSLADSIVLGHTVSTRTSIEGIRTLAAGHTMTIRATPNGLCVSDQIPYFDRRTFREDEMPYDKAEQMLDEVLTDAVECHLAADVEVGVALSGGIDSALLALLADEHARSPFRTFAVGDYARNPDLLTAAQVASAMGSEHTTGILTFGDYVEAVPRLVATEERPSTLVGMPFFLLSEHVGAAVKTCLCGEGADELFGGYAEYLQRDAKLASIARRLPVLEQLGIGLSDEAAEIVESLTSARAYDEYLESLLDVNLGAPLERLHLDGVDKNAMAHGVEMRVPYLDDRVYALVTSFPLRYRVHAELGIRKYILRRLFLRRFDGRHVDVVLREKLGAPSSGVQLVMRFDELCDEVLPGDYRERHELGFCFPTKRQLFAFELFEDIFLKGRGEPAVVGDVVAYMQERASASVAGVAA